MRKYIKNKLSVIIPTYNEDKNITSLITEIVNHIKDKDYEILIVDDGSTDSTVNFLANNYLNFYNSKINSVNELTSAVIKYYIINLPGLITNIGVASFTYNVLTENFIFASFAGIIVDTIFKYVVSKTWIWRSN